jgi:hypothetical protein
MDVLSSIGILTPDIRLVTSFESRRVAPESATSHSSKGQGRAATRNIPACTPQSREVKTETGSSLCRITTLVLQSL